MLVLVAFIKLMQVEMLRTAMNTQRTSGIYKFFEPNCYILTCLVLNHQLKLIDSK
jgi:hypothetical protein